MKIRAATANNRRKAVSVKTARREFLYPFAKLDPKPTDRDRIARVWVDKELAGEGFTYALESGREGTVHLEQVLEYNKEPDYLRDQLLYRLTLEAQKRVEASALPKREIIRRLRTSATQFYRLLDQTNYSKSIDQIVSLLQVLDCDLDLVVRANHPPATDREAAEFWSTNDSAPYAAHLKQERVTVSGRLRRRIAERAAQKNRVSSGR
jgi:hypothetical protein